MSSQGSQSRESSELRRSVSSAWLRFGRCLGTFPSWSSEAITSNRTRIASISCTSRCAQSSDPRRKNLSALLQVQSRVATSGEERVSTSHMDQRSCSISQCTDYQAKLRIFEETIPRRFETEKISEYDRNPWPVLLNIGDTQTACGWNSLTKSLLSDSASAETKRAEVLRPKSHCQSTAGGTRQSKRAELPNTKNERKALAEKSLLEMSFLLS